MIVLQWSKTQIMCLLILFVIGISYLREEKKLKRHCSSARGNSVFGVLYCTAMLAVMFDGITACTVNYPDRIPRVINLLLHFGMFASYVIYGTLLFLYWLKITVGMPKKRWIRVMYSMPCIVSMLLMLMMMPELRFDVGKYTNYSMGKSVYVCFVCVGIYCAFTVVVIVARYRYVTRDKLENLIWSLMFVVVVLTIQIIFPESLVSCIAMAMVTISLYINMEDPTRGSLEHYHHEMVMGFATLVENKDDSTGGHIRRTSAYAEMIALNLRNNKEYKSIITKDFLDNLVQSAPMHDIGKIGIPDSILQKPGKLTSEEFDKMKEHPVIGGQIIRDTFGHLFNGEYENMAYQVARFHHEKWNGKGYPEGISGEEIPLCARIMAVADVFDAVSAKRCYRDAMPLEQCYAIIAQGRGTDFDPDVVDAFFVDRVAVENIYHSEVFSCY